MRVLCTYTLQYMYSIVMIRIVFKYDNIQHTQLNVWNIIVFLYLQIFIKFIALTFIRLFFIDL